MIHTASEAATSPARTSAERSAPSGEQSAHPGIALTFPQLCGSRPAVAEPLELLNQAAWEESLGNTPTVASDQLLACAQVTLVELQALLADREGTKLEGALRRETWDAQGLILLALPGRLGELKRLQLEAGAGRPLTICFGRRARTVPLQPPFDRVVYPEGDGCGLIHPDSTSRRRPSFRSYCPTCKSRQTHLQQQSLRRGLRASQNRFLFLVFDEHGTPVAAWVGPCSSCGKEFATSNARVRRCPRCRRGHR
jgi:hypothetical protein